MKAILFLLLTAMTLPALAGDFFDQSERRSPLVTEGRGVVRMQVSTPGAGSYSCSAFLVDNVGHRPLIATARHCVGYEMGAACDASRLSFFTQGSRVSGTCARVVAETPTLDMVIVEATFDNWATIEKSVQFYQLSLQRPRLGTPLEMIGYPADRLREGAFTISKNCSVNDHSTMLNSDLTPEELAEVARLAGAGTPNALAAIVVHNRVAYHNCTVWGGNSGGPILIAGTKTVLGQPTSYINGAYVNLKSSERAASMSSTADYIDANRATLAAWGVIFAKPYPTNGYVQPYTFIPSVTGQQECHRTSALNSEPVALVYCTGQ